MLIHSLVAFSSIYLSDLFYWRLCKSQRGRTPSAALCSSASVKLSGSVTVKLLVNCIVLTFEWVPPSNKLRFLLSLESACESLSLGLGFGLDLRIRSQELVYLMYRLKKSPDSEPMSLSPCQVCEDLLANLFILPFRIFTLRTTLGRRNR